MRLTIPLAWTGSEADADYGEQQAAHHRHHHGSLLREAGSRRYDTQPGDVCPLHHSRWVSLMRNNYVVVLCSSLGGSDALIGPV